MKPSVTVCLLVRNEEATVARCLRSARALGDRWVVVDTGSTDGTLREVEGSTHGWPGEIHQRPWQDFSTNRNELLDLAGTRSEWLLLLDADHTLQWDGETNVLGLEHDGLLVPTVETTVHWNPRLIRPQLPWRYEGRTHEYLSPPRGARIGKARGLQVVHHADGGSRKDKFARDLAILQEDVEYDPLDSRAWFYLAATRKALGDAQGALEAYRCRIRLGGWLEEVYCSWWDSGTILKALGHSVEAEEAFRSACHTLPHRSEAPFELARLLNQQGRHQEALAVTGKALLVTTTADTDRLHVHPHARTALLPLEHALALQQTGRAAEALESYERILALPDVPQRLADVVRSNAQHALAMLPGTTL